MHPARTTARESSARSRPRTKMIKTHQFAVLLGPWSLRIDLHRFPTIIIPSINPGFGPLRTQVRTERRSAYESSVDVPTRNRSWGEKYKPQEGNFKERQSYSGSSHTFSWACLFLQTERQQPALALRRFKTRTVRNEPLPPASVIRRLTPPPWTPKTGTHVIGAPETSGVSVEGPLLPHCAPRRRRTETKIPRQASVCKEDRC